MKQPQAIQLIIEKLVCRYPEDRYQSLSGLKSDLLKANEYEKTGDIAPFFPGNDDKPIDLIFGNYLYGRESEFKKIIDEAHRVIKSNEKPNAFFIIHGPSGIGKTHLAKSAAKELVSKNEIYIKFKSEESTNASFNGVSAIIQQIKNLVESNIYPEEFNESIKKLFRKYEPLILNIMPTMKSGSKEKDEFTDHQHLNFSNLLIELFQKITNHHKLILQLDDLQWIDTTSLTPILLATSYISTNLIVLATSRFSFENSTPIINQIFYKKGIPTPKLKRTFKNLNIHLVELSGLNEEDIVDKIEDLLLYNTTEAKSFSKVLKSKTEGNPLYIQQLLVSFKERNLLWFDTTKNEWIWKLSEIEKESVTDNVADLLIKKSIRFKKHKRRTSFCKLTRK